MLRAVLAILLAISVAGPLRAQGGAEAMVQWIYSSLTGLGGDKGLAYLSAPERRAQYFSRRMVAFYEADDSYTANGQMGCVDFGFEVGGQDYNAAEIDRTLTISTEERKTRRIVTASFSNFGKLTRVAYVFVEEEGFWRIDDIWGDTWRVSDIDCRPRAQAEAERQAQVKKLGKDAKGPAYASGAAEYCYHTPREELRMKVDDEGVADFWLQSAQAAGHRCEAEGKAQWTGYGWLYAEKLRGGECRLEFLVTADQGLRLTDADRGCKANFCGPTAVIDGLTFPRSSQMDCALLPERER